MATLPFSMPPTRLSGAALRTVASLAYRPGMPSLLKAVFAAQLGIDQLAVLDESARSTLRWDAAPLGARPPRRPPSRGPSPLAEPWPRTAMHYHDRYRRRVASPREVLEWALDEVRKYSAHEAGRSPILDLDEAGARQAADRATRRYQEGAPLGPLDGVVTVIKEESAVAGLPNRVGTAFLSATPQSADATCVARLRAAGAILLGTSPMTELGLSPLGNNPHRAMPRNPHHGDRLAGGSSSGSAVAVASGLCPVAHAADGGGSIRIPASLCGVFGLKPSFGRVSRAGDAYGGTMNHLGPIGASPLDLALFLDATAGFDEADSATVHGPPLAPGELAAAVGGEIRGLRIGVLESMWVDVDPAVAEAGRAALANLEGQGATLVPVEVHLAAASPAIGYLSIGLEELADMVRRRHQHRALLGADVAISLAALAAFAAADYLDAQRLRTRLREQVRELFTTCDLLALPGPTIVAPAITTAEEKSSISDAAALHGVCRTMMLGNLTGLPAGVAPVGCDREGLPVALQLVGDAWDEGTVLAALGALHRAEAAVARQPRRHTAPPPGFRV